MKDFSLPAKIYIFSTILVGCGILAWILHNHTWQNLWAMFFLSGMASLALFFKVEGTTNRSHYNISFLIYGCTFAILGPEACIVVIILSNLIEWAWQKYPWYIQGFNIASYIIVTFVSGLLYNLINPGMTLLTFEGVLGVLTSMAVFTLLNHLMIGLVVWFARGENFSKSGVFDILPLMIDFTLLCMGAATALIWLINPFAIPLILLPLYLIYTTLKVPALERKTKIDAKTGLNNAKYFAEVLEKEIERADRFDRPLTVVLADLDLLRHINNTYGHLAGDEVLIGVANLLQNFVREYDIVARFGGEEFIILMPETTPQEAYQHIEDIRIAVERTEFSIPTGIKPIHVTVSFGIAGRTRFSETANEIVHNADSALYHSKLEGRNRVCIYSDQGTNHLFSTVDEKTLSQNQTLLDERVQLDSYKSLPNPIRDSTGKTKKVTADPEPSLVPAENPTPSWLLNLFIGSLIFIALPLTLFFVTPKPSVDWFGLFLFSVLVIITEGLSIDIYLRNTSISTSAAPIIAGTLLYGPIGAVVLSLTFALVAKLKHHNRLNRFVFNSLNQMIAGLLYVNLITLTGKQFSDHSFIVQLLVSVLAAMIVFLSTTALISLAIKIDAGISVKQVWKEKFSWMLPYYISMGLIAYALILGYRTTGLMGLVVILAPLLMLRISVKKYIDQTTAIVNELRGKNTLLERNSQEINKLNENLLDALSEVIDLRDPFTLGHSQYVTRYSVLIAKKLGLAPKRIERVRKASLIHDIGKIGIPDAILLKPNQLSAKEYVAVQEHTTLGANILDKSHSLKQLSPIVRHHHEWYDGSGYPDRLKGKDIPLEARIIAIADAVEAMASDRPYRNALSFENIVAELKRNSGSQFDPVLVEIMLQIVQTRNEYLLVNSAQKLTVEQCEYAFLNH